jgi:hypothetical protein
VLGDVAQVLTAIAAIGALLMSYLNSRKIQAVHIDINSRMDQLLTATDQASRAAGVEQGRKEQRQETSP